VAKNSEKKKSGKGKIEIGKEVLSHENEGLGKCKPHILERVYAFDVVCCMSV